ncbi:MAG: hypothetical protein Q9225_006933 [Loekoesia sp. 1 TL-2023]
MSGVEVASLAVAFLPLVLSAAKSYDNVLGPFLRYRRFAVEARRYHKELDIQRTIFRNECRDLLEKVIEHDAASDMLEALNKEVWSNPQLESSLSQQLGKSKQACIMIIELIEERLQDVEGENIGFHAVLEHERLTTPKYSRSKEWRHDIGKKLCFSFSKSRLSQNITALRTYNEDLRTLFDQTLRQKSSLNSDPPRVCCDYLDNVQKYQTIAKASRQVHDALLRACNKHTEHLAYFRVEVESFCSDGRNVARVQFTVAFRPSGGYTAPSNPLWFQVDTTISNEAAEPHDEKFAEFDILGKTLKRQLNPAADQVPRKTRKNVTFSTPEPVSLPAAPPKIACDAFSSENCMKRDFCDDLKRCFRKRREAGTCVGILENATGRCKHFVYPSPLLLNPRSCESISLGDVIRSASYPGLARDIPVHDRLQLAKNLAVAVLQYHSTPWMKQSWRCDDILFFGTKQSEQTERLPDITVPHLNATIRAPNEDVPHASMAPIQRIARNSVMFSLGVVLLEIAHAARLASLKQQIDLTDGREDQYTEFFTARRLAKAKQSVMGITYHNIVQRLVECPFPIDDLNDVQLQAAFHNEIISPLAKLEERFREFHLAE